MLKSQFLLRMGGDTVQSAVANEAQQQTKSIDFRQNVLRKAAWRLVAIFALVDVIWLPFSRVHVVAGWSLLNSFLIVALLYALVQLVSLALNRFPSKGSTTYLLMRAALGRLALFLDGTIFAAVSHPVGLLLSGLAVAVAPPLWDTTYASLDKAIGFDWIGFLNWANSLPTFARMLSLAYRSFAIQVALLGVFFATFGNIQRYYELLWNISLSAFAAIVISIPIPAAGAAAYYRPTPPLLSSFEAMAGLWHYADFSALRGPTPTVNFDHLMGVIQFPSYHAAGAILLVYVTRGTTLFWPALCLNSVMLVSTLPEGGHHLVDVIAGIGLACICMLFTRRIVSTPSRAIGVTASRV